MFDDLHDNNPRQRGPIALADALHALPLEDPPHSAWPQLAVTFARRNRHRLPIWPLALAASLLLVLTLGGYLYIAANRPQSASAPTSDPLQPLLAESAQLEALIANTSDAITSAPMMALGADLEDQLAVIDNQLGNAGLTRSERLSLWQQRVAVLRELAGLQASQQWLATRGEQNTADALVYTY